MMVWHSFDNNTPVLTIAINNYYNTCQQLLLTIIIQHTCPREMKLGFNFVNVY